MTDSPQTQDTRDIAEHLASRIIDDRAFDVIAMSYLIENELDKYVEEGTMRLAKAADRR